METRRLVLTLTGIGVALIVVLGGLSLALLATGGGDDNGGQTTVGRQRRRSGEPTPDLPDRVEGELRLFGGDPITLDPACASDAGSAEYIVEIFSGLVSFDQELNIIPDVAESYDVSPEGRSTPSICAPTSFSMTARGALSRTTSSSRSSARSTRTRCQRSAKPTSTTLSARGSSSPDRRRKSAASRS